MILLVVNIWREIMARFRIQGNCFQSSSDNLNGLSRESNELLIVHEMLPKCAQEIFGRDIPWKGNWEPETQNRPIHETVSPSTQFPGISQKLKRLPDSYFKMRRFHWFLLLILFECLHVLALCLDVTAFFRRKLKNSYLFLTHLIELSVSSNLPGRLRTEAERLVRGEQDHMGDHPGLHRGPPGHDLRHRHVHPLQGQEAQQA